MNHPICADNQPIPVELTEGERYFFCTCGKSSNQPFCDGAHAGSGFSPKPFVAEKTGTAYLCQCKQSANLPFCDGTHSKISDEQIGSEVDLSESE